MAEGTIAWDLIARDHASDAFKKVSKSADDTHGALGRFKNMAASAAGSSSPLGALGSAVGGVSQKLGAMSNAAGPAGSAVGTAVGVIGAAIGAMTLIANKGVDAYIGLADQVREFAERTGASAETASRFVAVTDDYSISAEAAQNALFYLGRAVTTNEAQLSALGVTAVRTKGGQLDLVATVESLADAYRSTTDPGRRAELVMSALGKTGRELIPLLAQGGAGLRDLLADVPGGQILDDGDLQRAIEFKLAVDDMHDAFQEISIEVGQNLVPLLDVAARKATPLIRDLVKGVAVMFEAARNPTELFDWDELVDKALSAGDATDSLAGSATGSAGSLADMADAALKVTPALIAERSAVDALHDSHQRVLDAQQDVNDAMSGGGVYADRLAQATRGVADAQRALELTQRRVRDLTEDVADKQSVLAEAVFHYGAGSKQAQDAARGLRDSREDLADANGAVGDAQDRVADAERKQREAKDLTDERREATEKLRRAKNDEETATYKVATAEAALKEANIEATGAAVDQLAHVRLLLDEWSKVAGVDLVAGPLGQSLAKLNDLIAASPVLGALVLPSSPPPVDAGGLAPGAVGAGGLSGPSTGAGGVSPGAVGVGSLSSGANITFNYPVPADQVAAYVEAATRTPH